MSMQNLKGWSLGGIQRNHRPIIIGLPILLLTIIIAVTSVNMPFWDEWELVPIFQHLHTGHFYINDFWLQHNEHRIFFPTLILVGMAFITRWNTQIENAVSLLVAIAAFSIAYRAIYIQKHRDNNRVPLAIAVGISLLWFSPGQIENWLWGWQLEWYLSVLGIAIVLYGLAKVQAEKLTNASLLLLVGGAVLAEYSLGNGMLIWPIIIVALLYLRVPLTKLVSITAIACATIALYFTHYADPSAASHHLALQQPLQFVRYVLLYMGRPLSYLHRPALLFGFVSIGFFLVLCVYLFLYHKERFRRAIPWIGLGCYALGTACITAVSRLSFGVGEALSSRYTTISSLFYVSILVICWIARAELKRILASMFGPAKVLVAVGLVGLLIINFVWGMHAATVQHTRLQATHDCTSMLNPTDACLLTSYPNAMIVRGRLEYTKSLGWGGY